MKGVLFTGLLLALVIGSVVGCGKVASSSALSVGVATTAGPTTTATAAPMTTTTEAATTTELATTTTVSEAIAITWGDLVAGVPKDGKMRKVSGTIAVIQPEEGAPGVYGGSLYVDGDAKHVLMFMMPSELATGLHADQLVTLVGDASKVLILGTESDPEQFALTFAVVKVDSD
jgi:hypothetical protein